MGVTFCPIPTQDSTHVLKIVLTSVERRAANSDQSQETRINEQSYGYNHYMRMQTPEEVLLGLQHRAEVYRREHSWERLYGTLSFMLTILRIPGVLGGEEQATERIKALKEEIREVEQLLSDQFFVNGDLLSEKVSIMSEEVSELLDQGGNAEEILSKLNLFLIMGERVSESLNLIAHIKHFEDTDTALLLWEAHLRAVWCYAGIYYSGFYRPPFSVATCRVPDWVEDVWHQGQPSVRERIVKCFLLISEVSVRFNQHVALEDATEFLHKVSRWLFWRGRWRDWQKILRLIREISDRQSHNLREGFQLHWLLPLIKPSKEGSDTEQESDT